MTNAPLPELPPRTGAKQVSGDYSLAGRAVHVAFPL